MVKKEKGVGGVFVIQKDGSLTAMNPVDYDSEDMLQELLANYPGLVAGDQVDPDDPRRWLMVTRELGIASKEGGSDRWSADHLFLDHDGIPTIIEVKRAEDSRIRREVVGQMLDYAANALVSIPMEQIKTLFEERQRSEGKDPALSLQETLGISIPYDDYWKNVKNNLKAGNIRLLFVADEIPVELQRVVEFLNKQMDPAEVLAVEIRKFSGDNSFSVLIPTIKGQTVEAQTKKKGNIGQQWNWEMFSKKLAALGQDEVVVARAIFDWAKGNNIEVSWTTSQRGSFILDFRGFYPFNVHGNGAVGWNAPHQGNKAPQPFDKLEKRQELLGRLKSIKGAAVDLNNVNGFKALDLPLRALKEKEALDEFFAILLWIKNEVSV